MTSSSKTGKVVKDRTDWARLRAMSEDEIERLAADDEDNPATVNDDEWAHATVGLPAIRTSFTQALIETWWTGSKPRDAAIRPA